MPKINKQRILEQKAEALNSIIHICNDHSDYNKNTPRSDAIKYVEIKSVVEKCMLDIIEYKVRQRRKGALPG